MVHIWKHNSRRGSDQNARSRKNGHRRRQGNSLAYDLFTLALAKACEVGHVEGKSRPKADHCGQTRDKYRPKFAKCLEFARLVQQKADTTGSIKYPRKQKPGHYKHIRRCPVFYHTQQVHTSINDKNVETPK